MDSPYITQGKSFSNTDGLEDRAFQITCPRLNLSAIDYDRHSKVHSQASQNTIEEFNRRLTSIKQKEQRWKEAQKQLLKDFQVKSKRFEIKRQKIKQVLKKKYMDELERETKSKQLRQEDAERREKSSRLKSKSLNTTLRSAKRIDNRSQTQDLEEISTSLQLFDDKLERASERASSRRRERVDSLARRSLTVMQVRERNSSRKQLEEQESLVKLQKLHDDLKKHQDSREVRLNRTVSRLSKRNRNITEERLRSIRSIEEQNKRRAESRLSSKDNAISSKIKALKEKIQSDIQSKQKKRKERMNSISSNQHQNQKLLGNLRDKILNRYADKKSKHQSMVQEREEMAWERAQAYKQFLNIRAEIRMKEEKILTQMLLKHTTKNKSFLL